MTGIFQKYEKNIKYLFKIYNFTKEIYVIKQ